MNETRMWKSLGYAARGLLIMAVLVFAAACGGGGGGGGGGSDTSSDGDGGGGGGDDGVTSVRIVLDYGAISEAMMLPPGYEYAQLPPSAVTSVDVEVFEGATSLGTTSLGSGGGTITNLPVGVVLTFQASGYDNTPTLIYDGSTTDTLQNLDPDTVTISMDPIDITVTFPQVVSLTVPSPIESNAQATVTIGLAGLQNPWDYTISSYLADLTTPSADSGTFSPASGTVAITGTHTLNTNYTANATTVPLFGDPDATYYHKIRIDNPDDFSVQQAFTTLVRAAVTNVTVTTQFAPALTALMAERAINNGTTVTFTATAADDVTAPANLTFTWAFANTGSNTATIATGAAPGNNTGTLSNYVPSTTSGTLTITIADTTSPTPLVTTITYNMPVNQFPNL